MKLSWSQNAVRVKEKKKENKSQKVSKPKKNQSSKLAKGDTSLGVIRRQPQASGGSRGFRAGAARQVRRAARGQGPPQPPGARVACAAPGPASPPQRGRPGPSVRGGGRAALLDGGTARRPSAGSPVLLFFFPFPSVPLPPAAAPRCLPARCARYLALGGGSFLTCARLCQWQRTWRPRRPISARLGPLPAPLVKESGAARESYLCAPGPAALLPLPTCQGEGALPVLPRRLAVEPGEGGKESRITSSSGSAVPGVHTHTFTCTDLKVQFRQAVGGTGKRGESSLDQTCHKRRTITSDLWP